MHSDQTSPSQPLRLLVVVAQAARGEELRQQLSILAGDRPLELRVVAPAYAQSMLKYLASDADDGIRRAHGRLKESVGEMNRDEETTAQGEVGEADPLTAIEDALGSFAADEIVILPSPDGGDQWAEKNLFEQVKRRFDLPVREIQLEEETGGAHAKQTASSPPGRRANADRGGGNVGGNTIPLGKNLDDDGELVDDADQQEVIKQIISERRTPKTWKQVSAAVRMHPNTCKTIYYRETGETPKRVPRGKP